MKLQYTHARLCSLIDKCGDLVTSSDSCGDHLQESVAVELTVLIAKYDESFDFQDFIISQKVIFFKTKFSPKKFRKNYPKNGIKRSSGSVHGSRNNLLDWSQ